MTVPRFTFGRPHRRVAAAALLLMAAVCHGRLQAQNYTFRKIAESRPGQGTFDPQPSINPSGVVAFIRELPDGSQGVYLHRRGEETRIADSSGPFSRFSGAAVDGSGRVCFQADLDSGGAGLYAGRGGPLETLAETGDTYLALDAGPAVQTSGGVVFRATLTDGTKALRLHERGVATTLVDSSGLFRDFSATPSINEKGEVAFAATLDAGGSGVFKIWRGDLATLALTTPLRIAWTDPSINAAGDVVSVVYRDDGISELVRLRPGTEESLASTGGFFLNLDRPLLNNRGRIAFTAFRDGTGTGLYSGPRPGPDTILAHGTTLFGADLELVQLSPASLNEAGQIAFYYELADGTSGIGVASPASRRPSITLSGSNKIAAKRSLLVLRGSAVAEGGLSAVEVRYRQPGRGKSKIARRLADLSGGNWNFRFRPSSSRTTLTIRAIDLEGQSSPPVEVDVFRR